MHATNLSVKQYFNGHYFYPKCKSDNGKYPNGFFQNEDCNCFPQHDKCSKGYHSHENDETSRCIPDKTPCEPGYHKSIISRVWTEGWDMQRTSRCKGMQER